MTKSQEALLTEVVVTAKATTGSVDRLYRSLYDEPHGVIPRLIRIETGVKNRAATAAVCLAVVAVIIAACDAIIPCLME